MTTKEELLKAPRMTREDVDRVYKNLYIIPTNEVSVISHYPRIAFVASYPDEQGQERFVSFEGSPDVLMVDNKRLVEIKFFHMDCSYDGMVRLFNLGDGFKVEQTNGTFVINPV